MAYNRVPTLRVNSRWCSLLRSSFREVQINHVGTVLCRYLLVYFVNKLQALDISADTHISVHNLGISIVVALRNITGNPQSLFITCSDSGLLATVLHEMFG